MWREQQTRYENQDIKNKERVWNNSFFYRQLKYEWVRLMTAANACGRLSERNNPERRYYNIQDRTQYSCYSYFLFG